jgi:replicative DNA helicase
VDIEKGLLSKIVESGDIRTPIKEKITTKFIYGNKTQSMYKYLQDYYAEYNKVPSKEVVERHYPNFSWENAEEPMNYYCDELRERYKYNKLVDSIGEISELIEKGNIEKALKEFQQRGSTIAVDTRRTNDLEYTEDIDGRIEAYERIKKSHGMVGFEYPWDSLNEVTGGIMSQELITIVAFQSVGKTWQLLYILHHLWKQGLKVALFTREMSPAQMQRRLDAIEFNLPYQDFKKGRLGEKLEQDYKENLSKLEEMPKFIISGDEEAGSGLSTIRAKIEEYKPDVFAVDGLYLLHDERGATGWQGMVHITQDTKRICRNLEIPGIVTTQAGVGSQNNGGVALTDVSFSKTSFGADSDIVLGLDDLDHMWKMKVLKARESEKFNFKIKKDFQTMNFTQVGGVEGEEEDMLDKELEEHDTIMY